MQLITEISISNGQAAMAIPLAGVIFASMVKDAYEDIKRYLSDKIDNEK
jgi:hypothetical protein